jgi:anti-sigma B factor antagonist
MSDQDKKIIVIKMPHRFSGKAVKDVVVQVRKSVAENNKQVTFDFMHVEAIDSFGIGQLISLAKELKDKGAHLSLSNLNDEIFQLFTDTGLDQVFAIEGVNQEIIDLFESSIDVRLEIEFEEIEDICIFRMSGVMDHVGGSRFFKQKFLLSMAKFRKIVLDFMDLTFFDSLSVGVLLDMHKLLKETGGQMRICGANYIIEDLFGTLNINAVIPIYPDREQALAAGWNEPEKE